MALLLVLQIPPIKVELNAHKQHPEKCTMSAFLLLKCVSLQFNLRYPFILKLEPVAQNFYVICTVCEKKSLCNGSLWLSFCRMFIIVVRGIAVQNENWRSPAHAVGPKGFMSVVFQLPFQQPF